VGRHKRREGRMMGETGGGNGSAVEYGETGRGRKSGKV
jgi:hypothetical protein